MVYIDLNPVRAAMAHDLEDSDYTLIQQRIREAERNLGSGGDQLEAVAGVPGTGSLPISIAQYLNQVDWPGRRCIPASVATSIPSGHGYSIDLVWPTVPGSPRSR